MPWTHFADAHPAAFWLIAVLTWGLLLCLGTAIAERFWR